MLTSTSKSRNIMKKLNYLSIALACAVQAQLFGATLVNYTAIAGSDSDPDGNNGTSDVNVWSTVDSTNPSLSGSFFDSGSTAWGTYSIGEQYSTEHVFDGGALTVGQGVSIEWTNEFVASGNRVGVALRSGNTEVFSVYFEGGTSQYQYTDAGGTSSTGVSWAFDTFQEFTFTLVSATSYSGTFAGNNISGTLSGASIDNILFFNNQQELSPNGDALMRNLSIIPEPSNYGLFVGMTVCMVLLRRRRNK